MSTDEQSDLDQEPALPNDEAAYQDEDQSAFYALLSRLRWLEQRLQIVEVQLQTMALMIRNGQQQPQTALPPGYSGPMPYIAAAPTMHPVGPGPFGPGVPTDDPMQHMPPHCR